MLCMLFVDVVEPLRFTLIYCVLETRLHREGRYPDWVLVFWASASTEQPKDFVRTIRTQRLSLQSEIAITVDQEQNNLLLY